MLTGGRTPAGLFAIHLADGVLTPAWVVGGFVAAAALLALSVRRIGEQEVVRVGLFTAAFFVASQFHIPIGVGTVHLMLNGVVGVVLRRSAPLALAVGLLLQALLFGHGGLLALGVNVCVLALPAVLAGYGYPLLRLAANRGRRWVVLGCVGLASTAWVLVAAAAVEAVARTLGGERHFTPAGLANWWAFSAGGIATQIAGGVVGAVAVWRFDRRLAVARGVATGMTACLLTLLLNAAALALGGQEDWRALVGLVVVAHLPIVAVEALATGVVVGYLERVKPDWLRPPTGA
jgi:cobalt/nickel transport system permease protein